ncbi:aldose 1-epimerase family protein [Paracoccus sp. Z330]|uniref:Aldose 1-epimerase family protein n=1 Tax=Paracoccus onchidii TaxID=3017813 RepID=A0ABT4ZG47_9RHOB|nr:aldose 1-epimerase family protein [Paracoccus onchidii]MDB6178345.1 aldose 1-epimerase family protein [Paracoccus onchidii]
MSDDFDVTTIPLAPDLFPADATRTLLRNADFTVEAFRYITGIEGLKIRNRRGEIVALPYLGQMIWSATFDGRSLGMGNSFSAPRHGASILEAYGAFAYHAGLLRNGTPGPEDSHPLHGEMPVARMDSASLHLGRDRSGTYIELRSQYEYVMGFGAHYLASPRIRLGADQGVMDIEMQVENLSAHPMELMYMLHANFDFAADARIHQPAPFDPEHTRVRDTVPGHVTPSAEFTALLADLARNPARMEYLSEPEIYSPEQVFYIKSPGTDQDGNTRLAMEFPQGDAVSVAYSTRDFPHCVRWILNDGDAQVAAFALPSTCEPEGYTAEKAKGHVRMLAPKEIARFPVTLGHLNPAEAARTFDQIATLQGEKN